MKKEENIYAIYFHIQSDSIWQGYSSRIHLLLLGLCHQWVSSNHWQRNLFPIDRWSISYQNSAQVLSKEETTGKQAKGLKNAEGI